MQLDLTEAQAELLRDILNSVYRDLKYEVADTDNPSFRRGLRERKQAVEALLNEVGGPLPDNP